METGLLYSFDTYRLDPDSRQLWCGETLVPLTPKVFTTLLVLVENHGRVLTKEELLNAIWPEQAVEEANLTQNISVLRRALNEAVRGKKYIATFPGRGYKFLEPVFLEGNGNRDREARDLTSALEPATAFPASGVSSSLKDRLHFGLALILLGLCGLSVVLFVTGRHQRATAIQAGNAEIAMQAHTLTRMFGAEYQPAWSRDGRSLAFVHTESDPSASAIYIQFGQDLQPRRLAYGNGQYSSPTWSPEGTRLAYIRSAEGIAEIVIADVVHNTSTILTRVFPRWYGLSCRRLAWSPDGRILIVGDKSSDADPFSLYLVYVANGEKTRLTYPTMDIIGDVDPRVSPDGTQVAFIRMKYQYEYSVLIIPATGGEARNVTNKPALVRDVDWETNERLVYSAKRDGEYRFWRVDLGLKKIEAKPAAPFATDLPLQFAISPSSKMIAFSTYHPNLNIWTLHLPISSATSSRWEPTISTPGEDGFPSFSPNGDSICFRSDVLGAARLWVSKSDGADAFPLASLPGEPSVCGWSPDGKVVVSSVSSSSGLYFESAGRPSHVRMVPSSVFGHPSFSRDGKEIFVQAGSFLYRLPAGGGSAEVITDRGGYPIVESQDGRYIYFGRGRTDSRISRVELATKHQDVVIDSLLPGYWGCWALTAQGIYFLSDDSGNPAIRFHEFASGVERTITRFPGALPPIGTSAFSISPDGRRLLMVRADPVAANIQSIALLPARNE